jgi:hypothetical protein
MKKKSALLVIIYLIITIVLVPFCWVASLVLSILFIFGVSASICALILNKIYLHTNHWKNQFLFEKNFISNAGYRDNISRNFEVVNLGSNPALFGFFYEKVRGQNWATGSQGLPMDFEILKYFHSYIKTGGYVLIPIMPFTSISQYIKTKSDYWGISYYLKFASILDWAQVKQMPYSNMLVRYKKYPLLFNPRLIRYVLNDVAKDDRLSLAEQPMSALELEQDARCWITGWEKEFDTKSMDEFFDERFKPYEEEGTRILQEMIDYCLKRDLQPVLITVPLSSYLAEKFSPEFRQCMMTDFIKKVNIRNVRVLDYMFDEHFCDASFYINSFFLNLKGKKIFTNQVMKDLCIQK